MKIKTSELTGAALDWAVAKAARRTIEIRVTGRQNTGCRFGIFFNQRWIPKECWDEFTPSTDWAQGGPIIDREHISLLSPENNGSWNWIADKGTVRAYSGGPDRSALIAAMRCYVTSTLGKEVDVPEELLK